ASTSDQAEGTSATVESISYAPTKRTLGNKVWLGLAFSWKVLFNLVQFLIILYVFSRLHDRFEVIAMSTLGLIYVTIRSIGFGTWAALANIALAIDKEFAYLHHKAGEDVSFRAEGFGNSQRMMQEATYKGYIDQLFLSLISLVCLYQLFSSL